METHIGKIIKQIRLEKRLSQEGLAEGLNELFDSHVNKGMISKWENGLTDPSLESARQLAIFFNKSLDYLLGLEVDEPQTLAAHHESEEWSEEELEEIDRFKEFLKTKKK